MLQNIHYSYSILLSHYIWCLLVLGGITSFHSKEIAQAIKLIGLLGILSLNVSSTYFNHFGLTRIIAFNFETLRFLRILLLCWLPWALESLCACLLKVGWKNLQCGTIVYAICFSCLYAGIVLLLPKWAFALETLEIVIYLVVALSAIVAPIICLQLGFTNTIKNHALRFWYKSLAMSFIFCAILQIVLFIPLYMYYFPPFSNTKDYAKIRYINDDPPFYRINFMPIYYTLFTMPFFIHVLYTLVLQRNQHLVAKVIAGSNTIGNINNGFDVENLDEFFNCYNISKREREVLVELIGGQSYAAIAEHLYISLATVKSHIYSIYRKTKVKNKMQLLNKILGNLGSQDLQ